MTGIELKEAIEELEFIKVSFYDFPEETGISNDIGKVQNAIKAINELEDYYSIGTVDECRESVENQKPKKPKHQGTYDSVGVWHEWNGINGRPYELCPNCGKNLCCEMPYEKKPKYCGECGQMLDWSKL